MTDLDYVGSDGLGLASAVRARRVSARAVTEAALARAATRGVTVNAFTAVLADRARADADRVDEAIAAGRDPGPLAGMPFAAKNLFDIAGVTTLAGSRINAGRAPATRDAAAVAALRGAGAILIGALNMDEYAYGFTTIGLPVLSVPVRMGPLPLGVQIIGAPFGEAAMLRVGARLLAKGVAAAAVAP